MLAMRSIYTFIALEAKKTQTETAHKYNSSVVPKGSKLKGTAKEYLQKYYIYSSEMYEGTDLDVIKRTRGGASCFYPKEKGGNNLAARNPPRL